MANRSNFTRTDEFVEVMRALSDPLRVNIMARMLKVDELPCTELERALPVTKSTISYHMKILFRAGLVDIRKAGRYYFYRPRQDVLEDILPCLANTLQEFPVELAEERGVG